MIKDQYKVHHNLLSLLASISVYFHLTALLFFVSLAMLFPEESWFVSVKAGKNLSEYWQEKIKNFGKNPCNVMGSYIV